MMSTTVVLLRWLMLGESIATRTLQIRLGNATFDTSLSIVYGGA
jgi:hypothetical protein